MLVARVVCYWLHLIRHYNKVVNSGKNWLVCKQKIKGIKKSKTGDLQGWKS